MKENETEKRFYSVEDIQKIFGIGRKKAIELMNLEGFPMIKLGRIYRVDSVELEHWIEKNRGQCLSEKRKE